MWFALKIVIYLLAAGGILAWCAASWRKSRRTVERYLRSLPASEVQELADRAGNTYEQNAFLSRKFGTPCTSAVFYPDHPDGLSACFRRLSAVLDEPVPQDVISHVATVYRAMENDTLVAYTLAVRFQGKETVLVVSVRARRESLSGTYLLDPGSGELFADDWVRNPVVAFSGPVPELIAGIRA